MHEQETDDLQSRYCEHAAKELDAAVDWAFSRGLYVVALGERDSIQRSGDQWRLGRDSFGRPWRAVSLCGAYLLYKERSASDTFAEILGVDDEWFSEFWSGLQLHIGGGPAHRLGRRFRAKLEAPSDTESEFLIRAAAVACRVAQELEAPAEIQLDLADVRFLRLFQFGARYDEWCRYHAAYVANVFATVRHGLKCLEEWCRATGHDPVEFATRNRTALTIPSSPVQMPGLHTWFGNYERENLGCGAKEPTIILHRCKRIVGVDHVEPFLTVIGFGVEYQSLRSTTASVLRATKASVGVTNEMAQSGEARLDITYITDDIHAGLRRAFRERGCKVIDV